MAGGEDRGPDAVTCLLTDKQLRWYRQLRYEAQNSYLFPVGAPKAYDDYKRARVAWTITREHLYKTVTFG